MAALADLFNSPTPSPSRQPTVRAYTAGPETPAGPSRRADPSNPLFLSPTASSTASPLRHRRPPSPAPGHYGSDLDLELEMDDLDANGIPTMPPPPRSLNQRVWQDPMAGLNGSVRSDGEDDGEQPAKKRRVIAKIDVERLMSENGIPSLIKAAKKFTVKGKGHETSDLKNLLEVYQMWAHHMFPKGEFAQTMGRIETTCKKKHLESAMRGYRDAFYPPPPSPSPPPQAGSLPPLSPSRSDTSTSAPSNPLSRSPAREPTVEEPFFSTGGGEEDVDLDEMIALEEMEREEAARDVGLGKGRDVLNATAADQEEDEWGGLYD